MQTNNILVGTLSKGYEYFKYIYNARGKETSELEKQLFWGSVFEIDGRNYTNVTKIFSSGTLIRGCTGGYMSKKNLFVTNWADDSLLFCPQEINL